MISRREMLAGSVAVAAQSALTAQSASKPNIVIVLADDLGCHDLGVWGAKDLLTPNIDALSAGGTRFTNWYSAAPVCAPARAALLTGRYPIRAGVPGNGPDLRATEITFAKVAKSAGYATGLFGKWHLGKTTETDPIAHGFDRFYGFYSGCIDFYSHRYYWGEPRIPNYHDLYRDRTEIFEDGQYSTELFAREAAQFIRDHRGAPFLAYVPFNAPHYPMHAPKKYMERFPPLPLERRTYAAMIAALDDGVGLVMNTLRELRLDGNTLVIFTADNGATREPRAGLDGKPATAGDNAPFRGNKFSAFDGGMHVPMIMNWPGVIPKGKVIHETGSHLDILPTLAKAMGAALPAARTLDGSDALPMTSGAKSTHDAIYWSSGGQLAVKRGKWKLVKDGKTFDGTPDGDKSLTGDDGLFLADIEADPGERVNLRRQNPAMVDELATLLQKWTEDVKKW
ncbi:MAG: sulfatase-like hydrolase/transferase [Candidatus Solibacter sp.]